MRWSWTYLHRGLILQALVQEAPELLERSARINPSRLASGDKEEGYCLRCRGAHKRPPIVAQHAAQHGTDYGGRRQ